MFRICTAFFLFLFINHGFSQIEKTSNNPIARIEELPDGIEKLQRYLTLINDLPDSSIEQHKIYAKKLLDLSLKLNDKNAQIESYYNLLFVYYILHDYNRAAEYGYKALDLIKDETQLQKHSLIFYYLGDILFSQKNYDSAIQLFLKELTVALKRKDTSEIINSYTNIGIVKNSQGNYIGAIDYLQKAIRLANIKNDTLNLIKTGLNICDSYILQKELDKAYTYTNKLLKTAREFNNDECIAKGLLGIGKVLFEKRQYIQSLQYFIECHIFLQKVNRLEKNIKTFVDNLEWMSNCYLKIGDYGNALELYKEFKRLNDSITDVQRTTQISEIHAKYQTMEKIQENELLTKDNQIIQDQLKRRGYYIFGVVALVIMLIVFTLFLYRSYTNKLKLNELLTIQKQETENRAEELIIMNEKLKELDDFKLGMMSMIVHDLKNPLNSILMLSEQINSEKYGKLIRNSSMLMKNLIMNIIDVQRLENAHLPFDLTTCSFLKLVNIALDEVDFLIKQKSLEIENNIHQNPSVKCDNELIKRVLVNLLTNAIKFTPANGKIILNVEKNVEGFIKIMISDTGEGIPQEKINEVFDKFVQIKDRKSGSLRASGLGLAFCKLVIEQSGGKIGVISTNKSELTDNSDITTTFWFTLPSVMDSSDNFQVDTFDLNQAKYIAFTQKEKKRLNTVIPQISPLKVYQTSEILTLLSQINDESESIKKWKAEVEYAVFSGNEKKFNELISL